MAGGGRRFGATTTGITSVVAVFGLVLALTVAVGRAASASRPPTAVAGVNGGPFSCSTPAIFLAERTPTQLYSSLYGAGTTTFQRVGTTHGWNYNAIGYDPADRYLYGVSIPGKSGPAGHLLRIDSAGNIDDLGAIKGDSFLSSNGANTGSFDGSGHLWVTSPGNPVVDEIALAPSPRVLAEVRVSPKGAWKSFDFTWDSGFLWGMTTSGKNVSIQRLDLTTGHVTTLQAPKQIAPGSSYGAAWTYGNGNLGVDDNSTGELYQVSVAKATSATPGFSVVSAYAGPVAGNNDDGAACVPTAADLSISNSAPANTVASSPLSWTITVTNHGKGISSGYVVRDTVPAPLTHVRSSSPGCRVSGSTVTCSEGKLLVGHSATYVLSATAPAKEFVCFHDTADVIGNEADPNHANDAATATTCTAPSWRLAAPPNPPSARGRLNGLDCSSSICVAVGETVSAGGQGVTLVERRSGSSFVVQPSPNPTPGFSLASLASVSCSSASSCVAVGEYEEHFSTKTLAEVWNGKTWSVEYPLNRGGATTSELDGVACTSSRACVAVGEFNSGTLNGPLLESWNGRAWTKGKYHSLPTGGATFSSVSCSAAGRCTAVGDTTTEAIAVSLSGGSWTDEPVPLPTGTTFSSFSGVSCERAGSCEATGFYDNGSGDAVSLAEAWNGADWAVQPTPNPAASTFTQLLSVSCTSKAACSAVGQWSDPAGNGVTLAERWDGTGWHLQTTPNPVANLDELDAVGCPSATSCLGVGLYAIPNQETTVTGEPDDFYAALAERWSGGSSWSTGKAADHVGAGLNYVSSLSCASPTFCLAATSTSSPGGATGSYERWDGSSWILRSFASGLQFAPSALSCSSSSACVAIGENTSTLDPVAQAWSGSSWKPVAAPPGSDVNWYGISCLAKTFCTAVGSGLDVDSPSPLAERWNGTTWTLSTLPLPLGGTFPTLSSVSCPTATSCTAVGSYIASSGDEEALSEVWNGTAWNLVTVPEATGTTAASLSGVDCTTAGSCVAVGTAGKLPTTETVWATQLAKGSWTTLKAAVPAGNTSALTSVSCATATTCTAVGVVGGLLGGSGPVTSGQALAERWDGKGFAIQPTPNLLGAEVDSFAGVSCVSASECVGAGVGWYPDDIVAYGAVWK